MQASLLRHSEHRYRTLVEQLPIGIYIDEKDDSCANIYSNPRIIEMLGYSLDDWVGAPTSSGESSIPRTATVS